MLIKNSGKRMNNKWYVFTIVAFGVFMSTLDGSIVNIALPAILDDFNSTLAVVEWVVMIYLLTVTSLLLGFGKLSDIYGHRKIYISGLALFTISSLMCGISQNIYWLIISRMFQGVASSMIMACTPALLVSAFPVFERGKIFGINGMVVSSGLTIGPAIGGFLIHQFSWRMIFFLNIPVGLAGIAGSLIVLSKHEKLLEETSFDFKGMLLASTGIGLMLISLTHGYNWGFTSIKFISLSVISCLMLTAFIINEKNTDKPLLDLHIFTNRVFSISALSGTMLFLILFIIIFMMPFFLIKLKGFDPKTAGYMMMVPFAFLFFIAPISGKLSDTLGSRVLCTSGMAIIFTGAVMLAFTDIHDSIFRICLDLAIVGIGTSIFISPNSAALMSSIPEDIRGTGGAIMATARNLGMVLGIALAGAVFNYFFNKITGGATLNTYNEKMASAFFIAFKKTMILTASIALCTTIITWMRGKESARKPY